jgi:gluconolactonase
MGTVGLRRRGAHMPAGQVAGFPAPAPVGQRRHSWELTAAARVASIAILTRRTRVVLRQHILLLLIALSVAPVVAAGTDIKVLNNDAYFPEGPVWYRGKLYYVEYGRNTVTRWDGRKNTVFAIEKGCGQSAVIPTVRGDFITTCYDNGTIGRMSADGTVLSAYTHDHDGNRFVGPNDFAPDGHGGIYFTASGTQGPAIDGKIFYIAADGTISQKAVDLHSANGLAVSMEDGTLYVAETEESRLLQFKIGPDAALSERRVFLNLNDLTDHAGHIWPHGVKIDSKGEIYIGQSPRDPHAPLAGKIFVVSPDGKLLRTLSLPSPGVPNFAFSPDEKTLYVTAVDQLDKAPFHGKVYAIGNN